jgi:DNA-binding transcriptional ArsR family regulator
MPKTKTITAFCSICDKQVDVIVPADLAEDRESYPFGYVDVHGEPQHALMLFLDYQLNVRDAKAYTDIKIAKEKNREIQTLNRMTEIEALNAIYNDPLRYEIYKNLRNGPLKDDELFKIMREMQDFSQAEFNLLLIPLIRAGLIEFSFMKNSFHEVYFLTGDFIVFRIPSRLTMNFLEKSEKYKQYYGEYTKAVNQFITIYKTRVTDDPSFLLREMQMGMNILSDYKYQKIYYELRKKPLTITELLEFSDEEIINTLVSNRYLRKIDAKPEPIYVIFTDVKLKRFIPKYLVNVIQDKLERKQINTEIAQTQLQYLYDSKLN